MPRSEVRASSTCRRSLHPDSEVVTLAIFAFHGDMRGRMACGRAGATRDGGRRNVYQAERVGAPAQHQPQPALLAKFTECSWHATPVVHARREADESGGQSDLRRFTMLVRQGLGKADLERVAGAMNWLGSGEAHRAAVRTLLPNRLIRLGKLWQGRLTDDCHSVDTRTGELGSESSWLLPSTTADAESAA